jgi:hypothetical protein
MQYLFKVESVLEVVADQSPDRQADVKAVVVPNLHVD